MQRTDAKLNILGGTFITPSFGHSGDCLASWTYVPEAKEEDERVNSAGRYILPERWLIPCNDPHSNLKAKYFYKRGSGFVPLEDIPNESVETFPRVYKSDDVAKDIATLLDMAPSMVWTVYHRAWTQRRHPILMALIEAMRLVREDTKNILRARLKDFPHSRPIRHMLTVLG